MADEEEAWGLLAGSFPSLYYDLIARVCAGVLLLRQCADPHLHTHAVVFNMTDAAGKVRSIDSREWFRIRSRKEAVEFRLFIKEGRLRRNEFSRLAKILEGSVSNSDIEEKRKSYLDTAHRC